MMTLVRPVQAKPYAAQAQQGLPLEECTVSSQVLSMLTLHQGSSL